MPAATVASPDALHFIGRNCGGHKFAASLTPQFAKAGTFEPCPNLVPLATYTSPQIE